MPAATGQQYTITTPPVTGAYYNVRIQLNQTLGHVGFYCNPSWGGQPNQANTVAQLGNSVWQTGEAAFDDMTIAANDPLYLPSNTTASPAILAGLSSSSSSSSPPTFNCTMINYSTGNSAILSFNVTFDANNRTLASAEVGAITSIYSSCCTGAGSCTSWKQKTQQLGDPLYTNFCQFSGQYCTPADHLQKLDLTSYGLQCVFPVASLQQFQSLETLILSSNPNLTGSFSQLSGAMAGMPGLRRVDLVQNSGIQGPLAGATSGLCQIITNGLQYIDLTGMGLTGTLPNCLLDSPGALSQIALPNNNLTGSIPNTIPSNSSLYALLLTSNDLTGSIPSTIVNAKDLSEFQLSFNQLQGSIPDDFGAGATLLSRVLVNNNSLSGTLPSPVATSLSVTYLDVSNNGLTALPTEWSQGFSGAPNTTFQQLYIENNSLQGPFPSAVAQFPQLLLFYANNNNLSGNLPNGTSIFPMTRVVNLAYNQLNGSIPASFDSSGPLRLGGVAISASTILPPTLNLAHNKLTGSVPTYFASSKLASTTRTGISLVGNGLTVDCGNSSYSYLDLCDSLRNGTSPSAAPAAAPVAAPIAAPAVAPAPSALDTPAATPATVVTPAVSSPSNASTASGNNGTNSSSISGGGIFGIVVGVLLAVAVATAATVVYLKRKNLNKRTLLRMQSSGGFSRFDDFS